MRCDVCKKTEGKKYLCFPEQPHSVENIEIISVCRKCKHLWFKAISQESRDSFKKWICRSTTFKLQLERLDLSPEQEKFLEEVTPKQEIPFKVFKIKGYMADEEDLII